MLKCNMNFQKSLELSNKKKTSTRSQKHPLLTNSLEINRTKQQIMHSTTQVKHVLLINSFHI